MSAPVADGLKQAIQAAVARHDFRQAERLLDLYFASHPNLHIAELRTCHNFLETLRIAVLSRKAHIYSQLCNLERGHVYRDVVGLRSTWSLDA